MEKHLFCVTNMKQASNTCFSKIFWLDWPLFRNVQAQDFYFERSQCEAVVAVVTARLRGLMMLPGGAQWVSDVPVTCISVRYNSHFPLDTSLGQSNSTCRLPRWPSGFPLMCTYQRGKWVNTWSVYTLWTVRLISDKPGRWRAVDFRHPLSYSWPTHRSHDHWRRWGLTDWFCKDTVNQYERWGDHVRGQH